VRLHSGNTRKEFTITQTDSLPPIYEDDYGTRRSQDTPVSGITVFGML